MNLKSTYAPPTYLKPVLVISTICGSDLKETAISFVDALNGGHAMSKIYSREELEAVADFVPIKKHKSLEDAAEYHLSLAKEMRNGASYDIWEAGYDKYLELYEKYCSKKENQKEDSPADE